MGNIFNKIEHLNCLLHDNGSDYSVYAYNKHSIQEVICEVVTKLNSVIDVVTEYTSIIKSFMDWVEHEQLPFIVKNYLDEMVADGTLADIINVQLFGDLNERLELISNELVVVKNDIVGVKGNITDIDNELINITNNITTNKNNLNLANDKIENVNKSLLHLYMFEGATKEHKFINMIDYALTNGYKKVFVPSGLYNFKDIITDTILFPESFNQLVIEGENKNTTVFNYSHLTNKAFIKVKGGSGQFSGGYIKNVTFLGNDTTTALLFADVCGYKAINCRIEDNLYGIDFYNEDGFTEFCVGENIDFTSNCVNPVRYRKKASNTHVSMHGSGLKDCKINQSNTGTIVTILDGVQVYNAPLDFVCWTHTSNPLILHEGDEKSYVLGNINIETFGGNEFELVSGKLLNLVGSVNSWGDYVKMNKLQMCENVVISRWGGIDAKYSRRVMSGVLSTGDNNILSVGADIELTCYMTGAGYRKACTYIIGKNPQADELTLTLLQEHSLFDQSGAGHVTLKSNGKNLVFNNPTGGNVNYQMNVRQLI